MSGLPGPRAIGIETMPERSLEQILEQLKRRGLLIGGASGLGWAVFGAALAWLAFAWLDLLWELSPTFRLELSGLAACTGLGLLAAGLRRANRAAQPTKLARRLDLAAGTGGQVLSGYDLAAAPAAGSQSDRLTRGLARMATARAAEVAATVPPQAALPARPIKRSLLGVGGLSLTLVAIFFLAPSLAETTWLRFSDPFGDHPPYSRVRFQVEPPGAEVLYGNGLDVYVSIEGPPVERVDLVLRPHGAREDEVLPMFREPNGRWRTLLSRVTTPGEFFVRSGRSRSRRFGLGVVMIPKIERAQFRVTPPAYTRRPPYSGPLPPSGLTGLTGTQVQVSVESNRPLSGGALTITAANPHGVPEQVVLAPSGENEVTGTFTIRAAGKFELTVTDTSQHASADKLSGAIALSVDQKPFVRIMQPPPTSLATPNVTLPVSLLAEDDYGVARLELFRSLNDSRALPVELQVPQPAATRFDSEQHLPLSAYGLQPGDVIKLFARVEDNDPAGAKGSESSVVVVRIISQSEFERMLRVRQGMEVLMSKYRQADRRLESLAEEHAGLRKKLQEGESAEETRAAFKKLAQRLRREAREIREAAALDLPFDLDKKLKEHLAELAEGLEHEAGDLDVAAERAELSREESLKQLEKLLDRLANRRRQLDEKALEPLEHLEQIYPLIEDQARFAALYQQQRDLEERLSSLKGRDHEDDPQQKARMRSLEAEQRRLREELSGLLDDIENHANRLPEDEKLDDLRASALKFADDVRASGALDAMTDAETGLADFSGTAAHEGALRAADTLEQFLSRCEANGELAGQCLTFQPALAEALGNTVAQLLGETGLKPAGQGSGPGGYSTRRSTLDNVGLYGQLPGLDQMTGRVAQRSGPAAPGAAPHIGSDPGRPGEIALPGQARAAGSAKVEAPAGYRSRVGAYFQRIVEEAESP
jgi:hypothetical protein